MAAGQLPSSPAAPLRQAQPPPLAAGCLGRAAKLQRIPLHFRGYPLALPLNGEISLGAAAERLRQPSRGPRCPKPKRSHKLALAEAGKYLKGAFGKGLAWRH